MSDPTPEQLRFPGVDGMTLRADFEGNDANALRHDPMFKLALERGIAGWHAERPCSLRQGEYTRSWKATLKGC